MNERTNENKPGLLNFRYPTLCFEMFCHVWMAFALQTGLLLGWTPWPPQELFYEA